MGAFGGLRGGTGERRAYPSGVQDPSRTGVQPLEDAPATGHLEVGPGAEFTKVGHPRLSPAWLSGRAGASGCRAGYTAEGSTTEGITVKEKNAFSPKAATRRVPGRSAPGSLRSRARVSLPAALLVIAGWAGPCFAEDAHGGAHAEEHGFHSNVLGVFVGLTSEERRENAFTFGLEYERRVSESFGVGALVERAAGDLDFWVYAIPFAYHTGPWKLYVAPGIEDSDAHGSEMLFRVGAEYAWEAGDYEIAPQLDLDFVDGETEVVVGVVFARGF